MRTQEQMSGRLVQVFSLGEELTRRPSQQELLAIRQVPFEIFINLIAGKDFTHVLHLNSPKVDENAYYGAGAGTTKLIFTDGLLPYSSSSSPRWDCWMNTPIGASYCAQIKTHPTEEQMLHQEPEVAKFQVWIVSNRKAKDVRRLFCETTGLEDVDLVCKTIR